MSSKYNCPKCRCGCLFEEKNKLICMNCGAEVSKLSAANVRHVHHYSTYTLRDSDRPVKVVRQQPVYQQQSFLKAEPVKPQSRPVSGPAPTQGVRRVYQAPSPVGGRKHGVEKRKKGCGFWILLYFAIFWLLPALFELLSSLF